MHTEAFIPTALAAMAVLLGCSAFFSCSEAALFSLSRRDRRSFEQGTAAQRAVAQLLNDPDRLLTAVLFSNLVINLAYFTLASIAAIALQNAGRVAAAGWLTAGSLLAIIFLGEMLPKTLAVLRTRLLANLVSVPLSAAVRMLDPLLPLLKKVNVLSRRLLWPSFQAEPYLEVNDLQRAVAMSTTDAALLRQEELVLQNIVSLSEMRVDELMRPRNRIRTFRPPVSLGDLEGAAPPSGYVLVTERDSDEIAAAVPLKHLSDLPEKHLEHHGDPVVYVPWCVSVGHALETMRNGDRPVSVVVNEFGETIGVVTFDDILETIFSRTSSRSARLLNRQSIRQVSPGVWNVTGMTSLRRLARWFRIPKKPGKTATVAGVVQEMLGRLPQVGDECQWAGLRMRVLEVPDHGQLLIELRGATRAKEEKA